MNFSHTIYKPGISLMGLNKFAKDIDKNLSVSRSGSDYYLIKGTDPMNFIQLAHVKAFTPMTHEWALGVILSILKDLKNA